MKPRVWMLWVPPLAVLPKKSPPAMLTDITKAQSQLKLAGRCMRGREADSLCENKLRFHLI